MQNLNQLVMLPLFWPNINPPSPTSSLQSLVNDNLLDMRKKDLILNGLNILCYNNSSNDRMSKIYINCMNMYNSLTLSERF